jgi:ribosomal-protein-alanine N-acetyltransferase
MAQPMIETERLRMRPLTDDDLDPLYEHIHSDPGVTWDGTGSTREQARAALDAKRRHFEEYGFGLIAVTEKATGEFLGIGGLQHMEGGPDVEVGYYLARKAWGKGYATELSRAFLRYAFEDLGLDRVVAVVRPGNAASKRVLAKVGLRHVADEHHYDEDVELWEVKSTTSPSR